MSDIWIVAENLPWAAVLVTAAQSINKDAKIVGFINGSEDDAKGVIACGANSAFALPLPADTLWEAYAPVLADKAKAEKPSLILLSSSRRCRDVAGQLAASLDSPCFTDGKNITISGGNVTGETLVFAGLANKNATTSATTVLVTIGAKDYEPAATDASKSGEVSTLSPAACSAKVTGRKARVAQSVDLSEATKVVSIGRGVAEQSDIPVVQELATAIGAEIGCSRPIAEFFKWLPEEVYVGISGQSIKPQLYVAVGISGQAQHYYGVRDAKTIVSINKDKEALMNQNADYYIVGDWKEVVPALIKAVKG